MPSIRLAIVGTSPWTEMMYLGPLATHPGVEKVAICGRNPARTAEIAAKFGFARSYTNVDELLSAEVLDAICIVTPEESHKDIALKALRAGLDVLCEKPLAASAAEAWEMAAAAKEAGRRTQVFFTWRWQPHYQFIKAHVDGGAIGRPLRAELSFRGGFVRDHAYHWRMDPKHAKGTIPDLASHMLDLGYWMFGDLHSVTAEGLTMIDRSSIAGHEAGSENDSAFIVASFTSGVQALIDVSAATGVGDRHMDHRLRIEGSEGTIEFDHSFRGEEAGYRLRIARGTAPFTTLQVPESYFGGLEWTDGFDWYRSSSSGVRYFVDCLLSGRAPEPDFAVGARVQDAVDAAYLSVKQGRRITLVPRE
jgi:predicted dehydrogenase